MIKRHPLPCVECAHFKVRRYGDGFDAEVCERPVKARSCPVQGFHITRANRAAISERARDRSLILRREQCGPSGRHHSQKPKLGSPPQRG